MQSDTAGDAAQQLSQSQSQSQMRPQSQSQSQSTPSTEMPSGLSAMTLRPLTSKGKGTVMDTVTSEEERAAKIRLSHDAGIEEHLWYKDGKFMPHSFVCEMVSRYNIVRINGRPNAFFYGRYISGTRALKGMFNHDDAKLTMAQRGDVLDRLYNLLELTDADIEEAPYNLVRFKDSILDINSMKESKPSSDVVICNIIPHSYDRNAYNADVEYLLDSVTCGNKGLRTLIEEMVGYCFIRTLKLRKFFILQGNKRNGKSTLLDFLNYILGDSNRSGLSIQDYQQQFARVRLYGMLANVGDDISDIYMKEVDLLKKIVSGDVIQAAEKNEPVFFFRPYATSIFSANEIPKVNDPTGAVMDRMIIIPFKAYFSEEESDYSLIGRLKTESAAEYMIKLGIDAIRKVLDRGYFTQPDIVKEATFEVERSNDHVSDWLAEYDPIGKDRDIVYDAYTDYCSENTISMQIRLSRKGLIRRVNNKLNTELHRASATSYVIGVRTPDLKSSSPPKKTDTPIVVSLPELRSIAMEKWGGLAFGSPIVTEDIKMGKTPLSAINSALLNMGLIYEEAVGKYCWSGENGK